MKTPRLIFSLVSGLLMCLGFPEIGGLAPVMLLAWIPLLLVEDDIHSKKDKSIKVFLHSYLVFLIYNIGTTWWIWNADPSGAVMAFTLNALLMSITFQLFHFIKKRVGKREGYIGFILIWISFEYTHYHWDLSWPWLNFGNAFANMPVLVQWYSYSGVLGGTLWILISNLTLFSIIKNIKIKKETFALQTPLVILFVLVVFGPMTYSVISYFNHELNGSTTNIIVTQPNVDTYKEKWNIHPKEQMDRCFSSEAVKFNQADLILAPETAISYSIDESKLKEDKGYQYLVSKMKSYNKPDLFIGMSSHEFTKKKQPGSREVKGQNIYANHYNAGLLITKENSPAISHKSELVLGVEKLPFTNIFPFLEKWAMSMGGTSGTLVVPEQLANIQTKETIIAPAICYESIYGNTCAEFVNKGAEVLTVITNDDWWGDAPGYKQHFHFSRLRALENRRWLARSANTGFSGFINSRGDIVAKSQIKTETALQMDVVKNSEKTFYTEFGDFIGRIFAFVTVLLIVFGIVKMIRNKVKPKA